MAEALIEVKDLIKSFDGRVVLDGINLAVERGSVFAIMGGSGCGKTTLLRHLIGVMRPDSGQIQVGGEDITTFDESRMDGYRRRFGMLFQMGALLNSLSVHDNIALPLREHTDLDEKIISVIPHCLSFSIFSTHSSWVPVIAKSSSIRSVTNVEAVGRSFLLYACLILLTTASS